MSETKIKITNLKKAFGRKVVLDGVDLEVKKGESLVVIGGSGTGKSVLIKCIQGILVPETGSIKTVLLVVFKRLIPHRTAAQAAVLV